MGKEVKVKLVILAWNLLVWVGWLSIAWRTWMSLEAAPLTLRIAATFACVALCILCMINYFKAMQ
jgi:hypothetical protein